MIDESKEYIKYARDVLSGRIVANKWIKLACKRFFSFFEMDNIYFDYEDVDRRIRFVAKMKHSTGKFNNKPFILLPWQTWIFANLFGFKYKDTGYRVTRKALIFVSRKNGKTALAAAISLVMSLLDNEGSPEIDFLANSAKQASIALQQTSNFALSLDPKSKVFKPYRYQLKIPSNKGFIQIMSSDSNTGDGGNPSCFVIDEMHAQKNLDLWNVMISGQGMRTQPLALIITTAGFYLGGYPLYDMCATCEEILSDVKQDITQFSAIYTLDEGDDYTDESVWIKASPSLNVTVTKDYYREQIISAQNNTSLEVGIKTKNFNLWCQSATTWISNDYILNNSVHIDLSKLKDEECYMGVDLSSISDITAHSIMFPPNPERTYYPDKYIFKTFLYVPQEALDTSTNGPLYKQWIREGQMNMTSGNVVDYDEILGEQLKLNKDHVVMAVGYDEWNSTSWAINATNENLPLEPYSQSLGNFNKPTKEFEMLLKSDKVIIDANPAISWMFRNVELKYDHNENCKPIKSQGIGTNKIDGVISMLEALGVYLDSPQYTASVFSI